MLFAFLLSIGNEAYDLKLKMPKTASCCCPHHKTWGHSDEVELRVATDFEVKICQIDKDGRHKGRKKRICTSCRSRIQLEEKCDKLQVRFFFACWLCVIRERLLVCQIAFFVLILYCLVDFHFHSS